MSIIGQKEFDNLVDELIEEGYTNDDAITEAIETLQDSDINLSYLFLYTNNNEKLKKEEIENNFITIENAANNTGSIVNATFAFQGLRQIIKNNDNNLVKQLLIMSENYNTIKLLIKMLLIAYNDNNNESDGEESDEEDDDGFEEKNSILQFLLLLLEHSSKHYNDYTTQLLLHAEDWDALLNCFNSSNNSDNSNDER